MLFDTDVLIWVLRGRAKAVRALARAEAPKVSVISSMELYRGARNRKELSVIRRFLARFELVPLSENIGHRANVYMEEFSLKWAIDVAEALIAATAAKRGLPLCTGNMKHYRGIPGVEIAAFRP